MAISSFTVWMSDKFGNRLLPIDDFLDLAYTRAVNEVTPLNLVLPRISKYNVIFTDPSAWLDMRIEVWRRVGDGPEYLDTETVWLIRNIKKTRNTITITAYSANELLKRRIIAYKAGTENATKTSTAIDDIMKAYVRENLGTIATDSLRNYGAHLTVAANLSQGEVISKAASFDNLLEALQSLAQQSFTQGTTPVPIFFDVVGVTTASGISNLEFRTYKNQRGFDRSYDSQIYSITLSEDTETLDNLEITYAFEDEANYIYIGGSGEESNRALEEVDDSNKIGYSPINRREKFVSYTNSNVTAVLESQGYKALRESRGKKIIRAEIRDVTGSAYGRDWSWGDTLTASIEGEVLDVRVDTINVSLSGGKQVVKAALYGEL